MKLNDRSIYFCDLAGAEPMNNLPAMINNHAQHINNIEAELDTINDFLMRFKDKTSPEVFKESMERIANGNDDTETNHVSADELMCELLTSLGYGEGVEIFKNMDKWYS